MLRTSLTPPLSNFEPQFLHPHQGRVEGKERLIMYFETQPIAAIHYRRYPLGCRDLGTFEHLPTLCAGVAHYRTHGRDLELLVSGPGFKGVRTESFNVGDLRKEYKRAYVKVRKLVNVQLYIIFALECLEKKKRARKLCHTTVCCPVPMRCYALV